MKRQTPSELRGEQLKRKNIIEIVDESAAPLFGSFKGMSGIKRPDFPNIPKYKGNRLGDVYQVKKSRMLMLSGKDNTKGGLLDDRTCATKTIPNTLNIASNEQPAVGGERHLTHFEDAEDDADAAQGCPAPATEKLNENTFRSVAELSLGNGDLWNKEL